MGSASALDSLSAQHVIAGRYRVENLLGRGGMGLVYAVTDLRNDARVALKRLLPDATPAGASLFESEYHTLSGLRHPCIVEVFDYDSDAEGAFYTMELIEGDDLARAAPMPWRDACRDLRDAAAILGLLHARQLLHRDLSPRNLLRGASGRLKLIDFGAIAPFGVSDQVVGTPPFIAPEALRNGALDQRSDLFTLGALAYWLVTGVHAFPARQLNELEECWRRPLMPPSELLALLQHEALEPLPPALDALISSLLRIDASERIGSTAELIDRLHGIAELEHGSDDLTVQGYLASQVFVGRTQERERALGLMRAADQGQVRTLLIQGEPGEGRTRFLEELVVEARLSGAVAVVASALGGRPYAVAESLLLGLLRTHRRPTQSAAAEHAVLLAAISKELRAQLEVSARPSARHVAAEQRVRVLAALRETLLALSRDRLLVLLVDDLQSVDDESEALLTALAHADPGHRLLLIATRVETGSSSPRVASLRSLATCMSLAPFSASETLELLRSLFGLAPYLERLAERLHRTSGGNAAHTLELVRHLVHSGAARYQDGAWTLPVDLAPESLPHTRQAAHVARLEGLSPEARKLARRLSIPHAASLTTAQCIALADAAEERVRERLAELERAGVLHGSGDTHRFAHEDIRAELVLELDTRERAGAHARLGACLAATSQDDIHDVLRACAHFFRAGDSTRGYAQLRVVIRHYAHGDLHTLRSTAPLVEQVYLLLRERNEDTYGTAGVLGLLAYAGYFADRAYARRYGDLAIAALWDVLGLGRVAWLSRVLGGKAALIAALAAADLALRRHQHRAPPLKVLLRNLLGGVSALCGTAAVCVDRELGLRYAAALEPFAVLGGRNAAGFTHRYAVNSTRHLEDRPGVAYAALKRQCAVLEGDQPIQDLHPAVRASYLAGSLSILGVIACWRDGPECLQIADRLEAFGPLHAMNADHLRTSYYAGQGDMKQAEYFRLRMEVHAVQLGSAWQVETWAPVDAIRIGLRTNDAALIKRAGREIARLGAQLPALRRIESAAQGAYLLLRGKYAQALPLLSSDDVPDSLVGWTRQQGLIARAYNGLGEHARARQICLHALANLEEHDLQFVMINLNTQVELALSEAGVGNFEVGRQQLDALLLRHAPGKSPVTLGSLHEARARVALREGDLAMAREQLAKMDAYYRSTGLATLIELTTALARDLQRAEDPGTADDRGSSSQDEHALARLKLQLSQCDDAKERARRGLQFALEVTGADDGFIVLAQAPEVALVQLGERAPTPAMLRFAADTILAAEEDHSTLITERQLSPGEPEYRQHGATRFCISPLWRFQRGGQQLVGALVLGFDSVVPSLPGAGVMRVLGMQVGERAA